MDLEGKVFRTSTISPVLISNAEKTKSGVTGKPLYTMTMYTMSGDHGLFELTTRFYDKEIEAMIEIEGSKVKKDFIRRSL